MNTADGPRRAPRTVEIRSLVLLLVSTALCSTIGYYAYRFFLSRLHQPTAPVSDSGYELTLVDHRGSPLSERPGNLKLVIDPFTLFRNFPNQKSERFTIDARGYRESRPTNAARPTVVVLGASLVFGLGLQSDGDTMVSQLNSLSPEFAFVNAGVVAYLSGQELSEMVHYADRMAPVLYIVVDGWNEEYCQLFPDLHTGEYGYNWQGLANIESLLRSRLAGKLTAKVADDAPSREPFPEAGTLQSRIFESYSGNLKKMADFARARSALFLVVFQPQLGNKRTRSGSEEKAWKEWQDAYARTHGDFNTLYGAMVVRAGEFCAAHGISFLDLNASARFREDPGELFLDTVHLNAEGQRRAAELLLERLRQWPEASRLAASGK